MAVMTVLKAAAPSEMLSIGANPLVAVASKVYAADATMSFVNDGMTVLFVDNQQAAATTAIGFTLPATTKGGVAYVSSGAGDAVPADTLAVFGPFPTTLNDASGVVNVTVSPTTTAFMFAVSYAN